MCGGNRNRHTTHFSHWSKQTVLELGADESGLWER